MSGLVPALEWAAVNRPGLLDIAELVVVFQLAARSRTGAIAAPELAAIVGTLRPVLNTMAAPQATQLPLPTLQVGVVSIVAKRLVALKLAPTHLAEAERLAKRQLGR